MRRHKTFVISDLHIGHKKLASIRGFASVEEHDSAWVTRWNETVKSHDTVWVLGDVAFGKHALLTYVAAMNGFKRLVMGNHDTQSTKTYMNVFVSLHGAAVVRGDVLLTHVPVHVDCLAPRFALNIHGHNHSFDYGGGFINVCPDVTKEWVPVELDVVTASRRTMVRCS